jgi:hypothetical protein
MLVGLGVWRPGNFRLVSPFEARYSLEDGSVEFAVDVRNGKIFKVIAQAGYEGKLFGGISVGMPVSDATDMDPRMYYDEASELLLLRDVPGVCLEVPLDDPTPEEAMRLTICAISVFAPEIETAAGLTGNW